MRESGKKLIVLFLCCSIKFSYSQILPYERYTSKNGLISDRVTAIAQDSLGMMWFGSYYGISRYNGQTFEKITLSPEQEQKFVFSIIPSGSSVFAGFYFQGGVAQYQKGKTTTFLHTPDVPKEVRLMANAYNGSILVASYFQLYRLQNGKFKLLFDFSQDTSPSFSITNILEINETTIWIGTGTGVCVLRKKYDRYYLSEKLFEGDPIANLYKDPDNRIWVMATGKRNIIGICNAASGIESFKVIFKSAALAGTPFYSNTSKSYWGIDVTKGLFNLFPDGTLHYYSIGAMDTYVSCIYSDRENNIWIAKDPGVLKVSFHNTTNFLFDELSAAGGYIAHLKNGNLLATNSKNLYLIEKQQIKKLPEFRDRTDAGYIGAISEASPNEILMSRWDSGMWRLIVKKNILKKVFYKGKQFRPASFINDGYGNILAAGGHNIFRLSNSKIIEKLPVEKFSSYPFQISAIAIDTNSHSLYIGADNQGIFHITYKQSGRNHFSYTVKNHFYRGNGLTDPYIRSLLVDSRGNLWAGTRYAGIFKISVNRDLYSFKNYNSSDGIPCTRVTGIAEEPRTSIWFATCDGVHRLYFATGKWEHYDVSKGLPSAEIYHLTIDTTNKKVWAVSTEGVSAIDYAATKEITPPPIITLTGIDVLGEPDSAALYSNPVVKFPPGKNSITFRFSGSSFINEKKILYKYILEGFTTKWSDPTPNTNITYASLPAGKYTFKVIAANAVGTWSVRPAVFTFEINQPFYKAPWFIITVAFTVGLLFYLLQNYRLRQKVKLQKLRLNIARDLHDDIGSALGSINILSKTATRKLQKTAVNEEIIRTFEKIGTSAQSTLESMDDIIWAINPEKDNWEDLLIRMKEFAIPLAEANSVHCVMNVRADDYSKLSMQLRRNIFLMFKESINNAVKHSGCKNIIVQSSVNHNMFHLQIRDDGKGFDVNSETKRNGIKNLNQRAALLKGKITIASKLVTGTTIDFQCPVR